ncbi:MAG: response regulator [Nitrospinaceae bacterium]|nr:response regulator transcription factor [Nitrospinaceae bacterium]NIR57248.1 response regulator transcription factor [Nitrospinaceae bacterium]NIS87696.1 response regulator transcription factor [Nitrospinaceae bacterium]NIT84562.1 response regulator transcription factor [Nitrospinaceae bacterium]NIU46748.1 response regulator transcription factor [Nitrospinaceae bacterium]
MNPKSILLIDDENILLEAVGDDLKEVGFKVTTAQSGEEGLESFKVNHHDLVITDLKMGGMDGLQVSKEIKEINPETAVIILTGYGSMESAIEAIRLDLEDYILKPVNREDLLEKVNRCLKKKNGIQGTKPKPTFAQNIKLEEAGLTRREKEVAKLAADGYNDDEIGKMLSISAYTVKFHLKRIFKKLEIHKRVELIVSLGK